MQLDIGFNFFGSTTLRHLDAAWYSLTQQDFTGVRGVHVLDNNTKYPEAAIRAVLDRYPLPVPVALYSVKHQDPTRAHSWSVNTLCRDLMPPDTDWIFWTRSDYLLEFACLSQWRQGAEEHLAAHPQDKLFVSSYCHLIAYNFAEQVGRQQKVDIEKYPWRRKGPYILIGRVPGHPHQNTASDAGVWLTRRAYLAAAGWMDETMSSWGFQQSVFQLKLHHEQGVHMLIAGEYFFHHMEHPVPRDKAKAVQEFERAYPELAKTKVSVAR